MWHLPKIQAHDRLSFFFYCYGAHRDLHSFPTRRSSDLARVLPTHWLSPRERRYDRHAGGTEPDSRRVQHRRGQAGADRGSVEDRKSTRLNSSHVEISYAVFCLKKKKHQQHFCAAIDWCM